MPFSRTYFQRSSAYAFSVIGKAILMKKRYQTWGGGVILPVETINE